MLNGVEKGTRVRLYNGMKATVTDVAKSWAGTISGVSIRPDGGKYKTRTYNLSGVCTDNSEAFDVTEVLATGYKGTVTAIVGQIEALRETTDAAFQVLFDAIDEMETTATTAPANKLTSYDFGDGNGTVAAHRHMNPKGDEGGIVADTAMVSADSTIGRGSVVFGTAKITNKSSVINNSRVGGTAKIDGKIVDGAEIVDSRLRSLAA